MNEAVVFQVGVVAEASGVASMARSPVRPKVVTVESVAKTTPLTVGTATTSTRKTTPNDSAIVSLALSVGPAS